ncbi:hypothetical protein SAMN04488543_0621 [Friedmanniella luteola]|uniref:SIMPL domain-containing protein n=1 Tax=Friedmanniella luteola TaxID=546871 RepID=A0A1H1MFB0_9ACTN|nr:SIMPL domain-containing protein [Friedmanniella luteola]SDR85340.1 hypothetical protein SAMN04488543_0621 [Friedmanniella luteola]
MSQPVATVRGEATLQGPPDLAGLSVTVHRAGDSAATVRRALAAASADVGAAVDPQRTAIESGPGASVHVAPVFARQGRRVTGYRGSWSTQLSVTDFDVLGPLVSALSGLDQVQVDGPWWSLRPQNPLQREARLAALDDARRRADDYAAALGATVVDVLEVSDLEGGGGAGRFARSAALARGAVPDEPELDLEPAVQTVTGQVTVRFLLSPAVLGPQP